MQTRRQAMTGLLGALSLGVAGGTAHPQSGLHTPDPATLQPGDFVWPKKPGAFIPYRNDLGQSAENDQERWVREKAEFLDRVRSGKVPGGPQIASEIGPMSYNDFRIRYLRNLTPGEIMPFSSGQTAAVGHVGIIEIDQAGLPWVIEALWEPGVVRHRYSYWIKERSGEIVWHGRLKGVSPEGQAGIAREAVGYVSRPYDFWNFDLADASGFYCSKLVWLCVMRATKTAIDDNPNPSRLIWLSPKQVLYSSKVERLVDPGNYAID